MLEAGSDTTSVFFQHLLLALANHPEVQRKAQEEIDAVVGLERLPELDDFGRLPYTQALIAEVGYVHTSRAF
jgi:cytochrome P450